jgi:hypothetical protein
MRREWRHVYHVDAVPHARQKYASCWGLDDWCPDIVCGVVKQLVRAEVYDAVVANYVWMSRVLTAVEGPIRILDAHDIFGDRHVISASSGLDPNWFFTTRQDEEQGFARADVVIGIQAQETEQIAGRTQARVVTVGHPITPWFLTNSDSQAKVATFGYFASGNPWNVRSVMALDEEVQRGTPLNWALAGSICNQVPDVESCSYVFGQVKAPEDFYRHVDCCINPMIGGTGLKIKTVEAIAYGRPVIGTKNAFAGLSPLHPHHRCPNVADVVQAASEYAGSATLRAEVYRASRVLYAEYANVVQSQYDFLVNELCRVADPTNRRSSDNRGRPENGA